MDVNWILCEILRELKWISIKILQLNEWNIHFVSQISLHSLWLFHLQNKWNARSTFLDFLSNDLFLKLSLLKKYFLFSCHFSSPNDIFLRLIKPNGEYVFCFIGLQNGLRLANVVHYGEPAFAEANNNRHGSMAISLTGSHGNELLEFYKEGKAPVIGKFNSCVHSICMLNPPNFSIIFFKLSKFQKVAEKK